MTETKTIAPADAGTQPAAPAPAPSATGAAPGKPTEHGGPKGPEPTRYGDWERNGRCSDF